MAVNKGKKFEDHFKSDWESSIEDSWLFRLKDQMSQYKNTSKNPCDYIAFKQGDLFLLEIKSTKENTFSVKFRQYPLLKEEYDKHISSMHIGVVLWFIKHDKVVYIPIETFIKLIQDGKKSFNVKYLQTKEYEYFEIPSTKLRVFMKSDYNELIKYCRGEYEGN